MDNQFDHIEDSFRKAFDSFEMPVDNQDWEAISAGLQKQSRRRLLLIFLRKRWGLLLLPVFFAAVIAFWNTQMHIEPKQRRESVNNVGAKKEIPISATAETERKSVTNNGNAVKSDISIPNPIAAKPTTAITHNNRSKQHSPGSVENPAKDINHAPVTENPVNPSDRNAVTPETNPFVIPAFIFTSSGLRIQNFNAIPAKSENLMLATARNHQPEKTVSPVAKGIFGGVNLNYSSLSTTDASNTGIWQDPSAVSIIPGNTGLINLRLDGGIYIRKNGWKLSSGLSLEGNPVSMQQEKEYKIRVPKRLLPYFDRGGNLLYWLAVEWKDSMVKASGSSQNQVWLEIPLQIEKNLYSGKKISLGAGFSLNPGYAAINKAKVINPYYSQPGSYWQYATGTAQDTSSIFLNAGDKLNRLRMGTGLMINLTGKSGFIDWELGLSSRYYFTNVWKESALPWQQKNLNMGLHFKLLKNF